MTSIRIPVAAAALVLAAACVSAAETPLDTSFLKRYAETRGFMLGRPTKPKFAPDGKAVLFLRAAGPATPKLTLFEFDVAAGKAKELLTPEALLKGAEENLTPEEKARRERQRVSVGGFSDYHLDESGNRVLVMLSGRVYVFDRTTGKVRELNTGKGTIVDPKWSPDGKFVGYVRDYDVYAYDLAAEKEIAVTAGGTEEKSHGLAEFVAQEEMDRHSGYWWSSDSKMIAYAEADHADVEVWHIADPFKPGVVPQTQYYPRPGKKNVSVRLGVKPVSGGETVWVEWPKEYEYLAAVRWDKKGPLTIQIQDRTQHELQLQKVDPATGTTATLLTDRDPSWVNLHKGMPRWYDDSRFLWISERNEGSVLYLVDPRADDATRMTAITPDWLRVTEVLELVNTSADTATPIIVGQGSLDSTQIAVWNGSQPGHLVRAYPHLRPLGPGLTSMVCSPDFRNRVYTFTSLNDLPYSFFETEKTGAKGRRNLPSVAEEPPFKPNVSVQKVGDYWTAVVRPRDFDPKKKYPVILDVYGGPGHIHVLQAMRNWLIPQWLADQGFVVAAIDNRGTPGRGRDWERAIYQKIGTVPLEDQVKGLTALCDKFPELDRDRVGIVGWSFGGYMAANAVLRRPDAFKAAVAGAPVIDWEDYDTHYTERYLGLLPESQAAYDDANLLRLARGLKRPLLLVHGTADDNVYYRHTLKLADALFRAGREFEALPLPGMTHMYSADPQVAERLWERTVRFFKRHLGEAK